MINKRRQIIIVTNGDVTESLYFGNFKKRIEHSDNGEVTLKVLPLAEKSEPSRILKLARREYETADKSKLLSVWAVIERDNFTDFQETIEEGKAFARNNKGFYIVYSNVCIEYWFLLHFKRTGQSYNEKQLENELSKQLKRKYKKNLDIYSKIEDNARKAITNGKIIDGERIRDIIKEIDANSSTSVYKLINYLLDRID